ncbi:MAG: hypothetical protein COU63_03495 [Candidatus Pacebacteria bacterium CG10_big_fil_rev_8_21_14_0_10_36_11]|nr:hypothetical protein [Candidatus Pacearchaeota archaeon]OIP73911.1 MAG: hypothetical protein AUK08_05135 [Candidatus Pacebacteria bacterium CG2_30_36_39]PIR64528.1 MAG: hypothetical protein COU63_03495 [Candidatus Pacebacteria bacterium CG10_big_fil_rev_8_21_14_0_10_36_11]PJC43268.1 MAG: hypothetical protein CO040_00055 [Candidatus Pacebacteria bacterium CG_4_9_14_0_2_um_filter_36_8]
MEKPIFGKIIKEIEKNGVKVQLIEREAENGQEAEYLFHLPQTEGLPGTNMEPLGMGQNLEQAETMIDLALKYLNIYWDPMYLYEIMRMAIFRDIFGVQSTISTEMPDFLNALTKAEIH